MDGREAQIGPLTEGIARNLREFGYPDVTAAAVRDQLALPADGRNIVGRFAARMLEDNGLTLES